MHDQIAIRFREFRHLLREAVSPPGDCDDVFRIVRPIAQSLSQQKDVLAEIGLFDEGVGPQSLHQVILQDDPLAVLYEHQKCFKSLRRKGDGFLIPQ